MTRGLSAGLGVGWLYGSMNGGGQLANVSLMCSVEVGMLLLAIATLSIQQRLLTVVVQVVTWGSTLLRRLRRNHGTKR